MTKTLFWQIMCLYFSFAQLVLNQAEDRGNKADCQHRSTSGLDIWTMWEKQTPPLVGSLVPPIRQLGDHNHYRNPNGPTHSQVKIFLMK